MEANVRNIKDVIKTGFNLSSEFNIHFENTKKKYFKFLNRKFKNQKRLNFSIAVDFNIESVIEKGTLCYNRLPNSGIRFYIANKTLINNKTIYKVNILDNRITANYLIWFLSHKEVQNYLSLFGVGAVFTYISFDSFHNIDIPLPKNNNKVVVKSEGVEIKSKNPFRELLDIYYKEFRDNYSEANYMTAAVLSGAIAETLLHNFLLEIGLAQKLLERKTLGGIIDLTEAYLIDRGITDFPLNHFKDIQQLRNSAIHPALAKNKIQPDNEISKTDFDCFNHIVKYFGL